LPEEVPLASAATKPGVPCRRINRVALGGI
jgi:hypothetical protein